LSSDAQCKLQCVTGECRFPCAASPNVCLRRLHRWFGYLGPIAPG